MQINGPASHGTSRSTRELSDTACDEFSLIVPRSVRLEFVHRNRERYISDAIANPSRDPFDRIGLAAERVIGGILAPRVRMNPRRLLTWKTTDGALKTMELDGVAEGPTVLEFKLTFVPQRAGAHCEKQLRRACGIFRTGQPHAAYRGVGVVIDCGELAKLPPPDYQATLASVVSAIKKGGDEYAIKVVPFSEVAEFFRRSHYGQLLSPEALLAAYQRRMESAPSPRP